MAQGLPSGIHIGTSGWNYDGWKGSFYPDNSGQAAMLPEYSRHFASVEVNGTFYSLPRTRTVHGWSGAVPDDFVFSVKASRYITHMKKLKDPDAGLGNLRPVLDAFGGKLGSVLFQLPPGWKCNLERLEQFLKRLPRQYRAAFEFRDRSWLCDEVCALLEAHNAALCIYDYEQYWSPERITADFTYLRLHGPKARAYEGAYEDDVLDRLAQKLKAWEAEGLPVFCYFDNDDKAHAPNDARRLRGKLGQGG